MKNSGLRVGLEHDTNRKNEVDTELMGSSNMRHQTRKNNMNRSDKVKIRHQSTTNIEGANEEFWPLSGRPYFNVILTETHVNLTYYLEFPVKIIEHLPDVEVPFIIKFFRKKWEANYTVVGNPKRATIGWKSFVDDNNLKVRDAVVIELLTSCPTIFKVRAQLLRCDSPDEFMKKIKYGSSYKNAITLD